MLRNKRCGIGKVQVLNALRARIPTRQTQHVRAMPAGYKVPKQIHVVESVGRAENGKIDQVTLKQRLSSLKADKSG
jgi:acyl-coenzyme A synthetase/AMP-(fatty) acid ligase